MRIGIVGFGRMGAGLASQALAAGHEVVGYDPRPEATAAMREDGL